MSVTPPILTVFAIAALPVSCVLAQEKPAADSHLSAESFKTLMKECEDASNTWFTEAQAAYAQAVKDGKGKDFKLGKPSPVASFAARFLAIAEKNPEGPEAIDALMSTLQTTLTSKTVNSLETRAKALKILQHHYVTKPQIKRFLGLLSSFPDAEDFRAVVADVIARNPDRNVQVAAYKGQIAQLEMVAGIAKIVNDPKRLESIEKAKGKEFVKEGLAHAEKARIELEQLQKTLRGKYSDLITDLSIGTVAPEVRIQTVDDKEARLSALRGKVVVLDIWATWCGPCKAMIPHEREMVERLKDKPFVLVSISADAKKETLTAFLAKEKMPWTHWWNGNASGIVENWDVRAFPTIYVLDAHGVIRYKDLRGEQLEKAVNALLDEQARNKTPGGA